MAYVYIFYSPRNSQRNADLVEIGFAEDWERELTIINNTNLESFKAYAIYETDKNDAADTIRSSMDSINPKLRFKKPDGTTTKYFVMNKEDACEFLLACAHLIDHDPRIFLLEDDVSEQSFSNNTKLENEKDNSSIFEVLSSLPDRFSKTAIKELLLSHGYLAYGQNFTRATISSIHDYYWANPNVSCVDNDWVLVLDDNINKVLHVFKIRKGDLSPDSLNVRKDMPQRYDLRIAYDGGNYRDISSKVCFAPFKVNDIGYSDDDMEESWRVTSSKQNNSNEKEETSKATLSTIRIPDGENRTVRTKPVSFTLFGKEHPVNSWRKVYKEFLEELNAYDPEKMLSLGRRNFAPFNEDVVQITIDPLMVRENREPRLISGTNIYFLANQSAVATIKLLRVLCQMFKIDPSEIEIVYSTYTKIG